MSEKDKFRTLVERFGYKDNDLTTPKHDEMLLWLLNKKNVLRMLKELNLITEEYNVSINQGHYCNGCDWEWIPSDIMPEGSCQGEKVESDFTKTNLVKVQTLHKEAKNFDDLVTITAEYPILCSKNVNIGFVDAKITLKSFISEIRASGRGCSFNYQLLKIDEKESMTTKNYFIEIIPKVTSVGELIRQINLYRSHEQKGTWIVLTEAPNLTEILKSQNILTYQIKATQTTIS